MVVKSYTIEIGGVERAYTSLKLEDKLDRTNPARFDARIKFYDDLQYFDLVEIKCNGTTEFRGFLEDYAVDWSSGGKYINVGGRDNSVIQWKKWVENFSDFHADTQGFFGYVNAVELIKFLVRSPRSDFGIVYPNNKSGWGIDTSKITNCSAYRTSAGDANWVKLRRQGYGWRNSGSPFNGTQLAVDGVVDIGGWLTVGSSPYLDAEDSGNYIYTNANGQVSIFSFANLGGTASGVNSATLTISWKPDKTWWTWIQAECEAWLYDGDSWSYVGTFGGRDAPWETGAWRRYTFDVSYKLDTVAKVNAAQIMFIGKSNDLTTFITQAYLNVSYQTSGSQSTNDYFDVVFFEQPIMGIYFESRMDVNSYPRNYCIYEVEDEIQDFTDYTEVDPNTHIGVSSAKIDFNAYMNETAYVYKDFGAGYFKPYMKQYVKCKVVTDPVPEPSGSGDIFCLWAIANDLNDFTSLLYGSKDIIALTVWRDYADIINSGEPCFVLYEGDSGGGSQSTYSPILTEGASYTFDILRNGAALSVVIYENDVYWWTLNLTLSGSDHTFRYLYGCATANTSTASNCDADIENLEIETETELITPITGNTFKDIIHSWEPRLMDNIRIRITSATSDASWAISQLYLYKPDNIDYRVWREDTVYDEGETWNKVSNNGFEDDLTDWTINISRLAYIVSGGAYEGSKYLMLELDWAGSGYAIQELSTEVLGSTVKGFTFYATSDGAYSSGQVRVTINYSDDTSTVVDNTVYKGAGWVLFDLTSSVDITKTIVSISFENIDINSIGIDSVSLLSYTPTFMFPDEQYITAMSIDDDYAVPIGPLNISKGRLLDTINEIVKMCHDSYISFETWMSYDEHNTIHFADQKGTDKSATISFIKGTHLGGVNKDCSIGDTAQRVQVIGKSEGKKQDDVSSDWIADTTEMANVGTFYEDIVTEKTVANKAVAELLANIFLSTSAPAKESIEVIVNNDEEYAVGAYASGDYVTVTDSITGTSGAQRVFNIRKSINAGSGCSITLNVNAKRIDENEAFKDIYNKLKQLGIAGTIAADWGGEALNATKVDAVTSLSSLFEKTAKNDTVDAPSSIKDPSWSISPNATAYTAATGHVGGVSQPEYYDFDYGMKFTKSDDWMKFTGPTSDSNAHTLLADIKCIDADGISFTIPLSKNPKFTAEVKCVKDTASPTPSDWRDGDYFDIGMYNITNSRGFFVRFIKESGIINAYAMWNNDGILYSKYLRGVTISDVNYSENNRYKIEIITEKDNNIVIFNLYDVSDDAPEESYPPSVIVTNVTLSNTIIPCHLYMSANNAGSSSNLCQVYIYSYKLEIEKVKT